MADKYEKVGLDLRTKDGKSGPLSVEHAKELIGWEAESDSDKPFETYLFRDATGVKVRLTNNPSNRPFRMNLAKRYSSEIIRGKWKLNGETIVIDRKGHVQSGQHRLVGLILAEQERAKNPTAYRDQFGWRGAITIEVVIVTGISDRTDVVDTLDLGQKRSLGDVIFRRDEFEDLNEKEQKRLANVLAGATRLVWLRVGGRVVSDAPHFPHSEALDFLETHPRLKDAVNFVFTENGGSGAEGNKIQALLSLGYAAGLMYLMGTAKTDPIKFEEKGSEAINFKLWPKAEEFWTLFASGAGLEKGNPILSLRNLLLKTDASSGTSRDEICGFIVKAWNLWIDGKEGSVTDIKVKKVKDESGKLVPSETPRIGGLDVEHETIDEEEEPVEEAAEGAEEPEEPEPPKTTGKGKKTPAKPKGAKPAKGKAWKKGDLVNVKNTEVGDYTGKIKQIDGENVIVTADADNEDYAVSIADLSSAA